MLNNIVNYIPDFDNGRPLSFGKVFFLIENYDAPGNSSDIDETKLAQVFYRDNGNIIYVPQPIYTTKGGALAVGCLTDQPDLQIAQTVRKVAVYNKCGKLLYQAFYNGSAESGCVQIGGDLGLVVDTIAEFVDFGSVADPATCFQDFGFLPSVLQLETEVFNATFASLSAGVLTLPFNYTMGVNGLDVFVNGSLVSDWLETTINTITFTPEIIADVTSDTAIQVKYRYVQLN